MEFIFLLVVLMPGLMIYSVVRNLESNENDPEYVILIRGLFFSLPFLFLVFLILKYLYGFISPRLVYIIINKPIYIVVYFIMILVYSVIVGAVVSFYKTRIRPPVNKAVSKFFGRHSHDGGYASGWKKIAIKYLDEYEALVGRLKLNGNTIALGQIVYISNDSVATKDICFEFENDYREYFLKDDTSLLENICTYVDMKSGYVLELYNGVNQIKKLPKVNK